ncbi:uncharacterized protein LOC127735695 [Mytilus californianus]|uniref:uncharacterized protein LOC127735695 n=1 Tax=Mytilus californianus TaxID=6549 RepID=UPI0022473C09|nr:uncharacterized protein LOC127735695 [Mytilus californianus]
MVILASTSSMNSSKPFYQLILSGDSNHDGNWELNLRRREDKALQQNRYDFAFKTINEERYRLNCNEYRTFWVSWKEGKIKLGRGKQTGNDEIFWYTDNDPFVIREIGVINAWGSTGKWKIPITINDRFTGQYNKCQRNDIKANIEIVDSVQAISVIRCSAICDLMKKCIGFNYKAQGKRCALLSAGENVLTEIPKLHVPGWQFYTKCFEKKEVCLGCLI